MIRLVLLGCLLASACSTEEIVPGECGNGIVDPREDCDIDHPDCENCSIKCNFANATGCTFPGTEGFVCGPDGFCHAPSGVFELSRSFSMPVAGFALSDVNTDGTSDLLVQSQTAISAVFAPASEAESRTTVIQTPIARGPASFAEVDEDSTLDVLLPTSDGIVAYTNEFGVPSPYPFPSPVGDGLGAALFVRPVADGVLGLIRASEDQTALEYLVVDVQQEPLVILGRATLCGATAESDAFAGADVFDVKPDSQVAAVQLIPNDGTDKPRMCLVTLDRAGNAFSVLATAFPITGDIQSPAVLSRLRADECPSMVVRVAGALVEFQPQVLTSPCKLAAPQIALGQVPPGAVPVASIPLVPAIPSHRLSALALSTGIYAIDGLGANEDDLVELYRSDRAITTVSTVDLDRDGDLDAVATAGTDDIDILDRRSGPDGFLRFRFDTEGPIKTLVIGDYDGDEHRDIAYIETGIPSNAASSEDSPVDPFGPETVERLSIAYGTSDQLLPGAVVGTFSFVVSLINGQIIDSTDQLGVVDDLAIVFLDFNSPTGGPALSLLHGNPQRSMLAFFDPRDQPASPESQFRAVVSGRFGTSTHDVIAVEQFQGIITLYLSRGATGAELEEQINAVTDELLQCKFGNTPVDPNQAGFCVDDARYVAWPEAATDVVIAIDEKLDMVSFDPTLLETNMFVVKPWSDALVIPDRFTRNELKVNALKRLVSPDGSSRLLVGMGPSFDPLSMKDPTIVAALNLCEFSHASGPNCIDISAAITERLPDLVFQPDGSESVVTCIDADLARVAPTRRFEPPEITEDELVVLCRLLEGRAGDPLEPFFIGEMLFRVSVDMTRISTLEAFSQGFAADRIEIADVTRDGIDDIVLFEGLFGLSTFRVLRQCTSRDACGGGVTGPTGPIEMGDK